MRFDMSWVCEICGKEPLSGNRISHAHNVSKRRWMPNLQRVRVVTENGTVKRMRVCTSCIRSERFKKPGRTVKTD